MCYILQKCIYISECKPATSSPSLYLFVSVFVLVHFETFSLIVLTTDLARVGTTPLCCMNEYF